MDRDEILEKYRQEGVDEGREEANRRGDDAGFYAMCVLALLLKALLSMYRQSPKGAVAYAIMAGAFVLTAFCGVDAVLVILASAAIGLAASHMAKRRAAE